MMKPKEINFPCPQCGQTGPLSWWVSEEAFALMKVRRGTTAPVEFSSFEGVPVLPHICTGCGYTLLFKADLEDIPRN